ncbi:hypothetical protein NJB1604_41780 [Mycobacterium marinum]|uniref:hypothetical protein n=1 Tax=Mycobacterium marinum TaxID=1781 RepID=UPI0021C280E3|nr:hypothetical protein [Mycobacterium marinum]GJO52387.1 hypothetical protein NJB1604_41780 [Mycobacterium marinum]
MKITFVPTRLRRSGQSNGNRKRGTPRQLFGGRIRLSTVVLMVAFLAVWWLYDTYNPQHSAGKTTSPSQVVPPGFVPDPNYTWVPRTRVQPPTTATRPTPTTTSPTPTPTPTTSTPVPGPSAPPCLLPPPFCPATTTPPTPVPSPSQTPEPEPGPVSSGPTPTPPAS